MAELDTYTEVPVRVQDDSGTLRLSQSVLALDDKDGNEVASVSCGAGLGGDFVTLSFKDREGVFYLRDVLADWVASFNPEEGAKLPRSKSGKDE
jgi:hypothetical protein